jgi:hypothetical protein
MIGIGIHAFGFPCINEGFRLLAPASLEIDRQSISRKQVTHPIGKINVDKGTFIELQEIDRPSSVSSITQARSTRVASARCDRGVTDLTDPLPAACEASNVSAGSADGGLNITRVGEGQ